MASIVSSVKTARKAKTPPIRLLLLNAARGVGNRLQLSAICRRDADIGKALQQAMHDSTWISASARTTESLLRACARMLKAPQSAKPRWGRLLTLEPPLPTSMPLLQGLFEDLIGDSPGYAWLPLEQVTDAVTGEAGDPRDVFIAGAVDTKFGLMTLVRGDADRITVPLAIFRPSRTSKPDFTRFELDDFGHTVRFGDYEASAHFILYEADADYRKRTKKTRQAEERSFGASLRRLRILKRVPQSGFVGLTAKTIGRIERGDVARPHGETLHAISKTLGIPAELIETY